MSNSNKQYCFTNSGEDIYLFTLSNSKGTEVCITNYGATITSFTVVQKDGTKNNIVLGFDKVEEYMGKDYLKANPYFGAAVGRYGNRIKSGKFSIDGKEYSVKTNLGTEHLHGGTIGFDKRVWKVDSFSQNILTLSYHSPDGEEDYPGNLDVTIKYELSENDELSNTFSAVTDKPTAINLTHHSYFNLDNGKGFIDDHLVKINGSAILEQDETLTVTGKLIPVDNTPYDFRQFKRINTNWNTTTGYDQSFVIDNPDINTPAAEAYSERSGLRLQIFTSEPIVHLYTGVGIPTLTGKGGQKYGAFAGFCLETQIHPNAINIPAFPNTVLRPGETYHHKTVYKITRAPEK
ncbi:MAG: aldose epimerase family protein [Chitinophagaceae bacterium]